MKKLLLTLVFCSVPVWATAYSAAASGPYLSASTWSPSGVPGASDTVTISFAWTVTCAGVCTAQTITLGGGSSASLVVANGGSLTVGASTANTVITVGAGTDLNVQAGGSLSFGNQPATDQEYNLTPGLLILGTFEFAGTVTAQETIGPRSGGTLLCHGGGVLQFNPASGGLYTVTAQYFAPWGNVNSDATSWSNPCTMRTKAGAAGSNFFFRNFSTSFVLKFNLAYTDLTHGCGDGLFCIENGVAEIFSHVRFAGNGVSWRANFNAVDAGDGFQWSYVSFRNISSGLNLSAWLQNNGLTTCAVAFSCSLDHISTYSTSGGADNRLQIDVSGTTITNSSFVGELYAVTASNLSVSNTLFSSDDTSGDTNGFFWPRSGGGDVVSGSVWLYPDCFGNSGQKCHGADEGGTLGTAPNIFEDVVLDGGGYGAGHAIGNWEIPSGPYNIDRMLAINRYSSISDAIGTTTYAGDLNHITSVDANDSTSPGATGEAPLAQEISTHAYQWGAFHNSINASQLFTVQHGSASGGFQPQYNASFAVAGCTFSVASNVVIVASCANSLPTTAAPDIPAITCTGLVKNAWLNGVTMTPTAAIGSTGWSATVGDYTHTNYGAVADTSGTCYAGFYYDDNVSYNVSSSGYGGGFNAWNPAAGKPGSMYPNASTAVRLTFASNGSSNGSSCADLQTAGALGGTAPGDFAFKTSGIVGPATVLAVPNPQEATLGQNQAATVGSNGLGAGNCPAGQNLTIAYNFWLPPATGTSKSYGDPGKGAHELIGLNPAHYCPVCTAATWDYALSGGNSTLTDARDQISCNIGDGIGPGGMPCTADHNASLINLRAYLKRAYTPYNGQLTNAAPDGTTFGAVAGFPAAIIQ